VEEIARNLIPIDIEDEMRSSYLDYSMSVIIGRALPDVRDGLKPVHRRILYAMFREKMLPSSRYSKCAGVVGEVLKKYHPHGDSAVYDALVRMAQPWNMRMPLVDGQGNFGSVDGDPAAAYRYTESRMTRMAEYLISPKDLSAEGKREGGGEIDKDTVNFQPNFDGQTEEPTVLPAAYPNLLVNGSDGIAVGMATKIPPHNLGEIIDAVIALTKNPEITVDELMQHVPGPDFPTAGTIYGNRGVYEAYTTGRGRVIVRGHADYEQTKTGRDVIIIDELPFQVNKARLLQEIANLVKTKRIDGISALRDESDRSGMRIVVELKRDAVREIMLNLLFKHTALQSTFGVILLAIVHNRPQVLTLKEMLSHWLQHRRDVTIRRCRYDLRKAEDRKHLLDGYLIALDNIEEVIKIIRQSPNSESAQLGLINRFGLSPVQSEAILNMRLARLTGLERDKIESEYADLERRITRLKAILGSEETLMEVIRTELLDVRQRFANDRRTRFTEATGELTILDLIADEEQVVTLSVNGYIKRTSMTHYQEQRRGGFGKRGMKTRDADSVQDIFTASTHSFLLVFTDKGWVFKVPVYEVPQVSRDARGTPIVNLVKLTPEDSVVAVVSVVDFDEPVDLLFCSRKGQVKRTPLAGYRNIRSSGIRAHACAEGDTLYTVRKATDDTHLLIATRDGMSIRFKGGDVRPMGRVARGVRGIRLQAEDEVASLSVVSEDSTSELLTVTSNGFGKRTPLDQYRPQKRGGQGLIDIVTDERNGPVTGAVVVDEADQVMLITNTGRVIKVSIEGIRRTNRNTKGVTIMRVDKDEHIVSIARVVDAEDEETENDITAEGEDAIVEGVEDAVQEAVIAGEE
jgi:DNA gyrase subunit A